MDARKKELVNGYKQRLALGGVYALRCRETNRQIVLSSADLQGAKNQFQFARATGSCVKPALREDWEAYGPEAFEFLVLEELRQGETQTRAEFLGDLAVLLELWEEKLKDKGNNQV